MFDIATFFSYKIAQSAFCLHVKISLKIRAIYSFTTQNLLCSKQRKGNLKKLPYTMYLMKLGKIEKSHLFSLGVFERFCCATPRIFYKCNKKISFVNHPFVSF